MTEDIELLMIGSLVAARLVAMLLRGGRDEHRPYLALLAADLVALLVARQVAVPAITFAAEAVGVVLAVGPALLDWLEGWLVKRPEGTGRAVLVARVREVLVPGKAATHRRRALEQAALAHAGDSDRAIAAVEEELRGTQDPAHAGHLRGEIVRLLLAAGRTVDGVARADRQLSGEDYLRSPALTSAMSVALSEQGRLRDGLGLLALLERQAANNDPTQLPLLMRARVGFIAGAGLRDDVAALLEQRSISSVLAQTDQRHLRELAAAAPVPDAEMVAVAQDLAHRLLELGQRTSAPMRHRAPLTLGLIVANLAVMGLVTWLGLGNDELGLTRAGALYGAAVHSGEWWRLWSAMFLHGGAFHLLANMYALYQLGRATEEMLGSPRFAVIYFLSGLGGALASLWMDRGLSVGASGAIMGLLAALTTTVFVRRNHFHPTTRRVLLGNLLFFGALQIFLGWQVPMIDSAAHAGGFVVGVLATAGLVPAAELGTLARRLVSGFAIVLAGLCIVTAVLVVRRPLEVTLLRLATSPIEVAGVRLEAPRAWRLERSDLLVDPALGIELHVELSDGKLHVGSPQANDPRVRPLLSRISETATTLAGTSPRP